MILFGSGMGGRTLIGILPRASKWLETALYTTTYIINCCIIHVGLFWDNWNMLLLPFKGHLIWKSAMKRARRKELQYNFTGMSPQACLLNEPGLVFIVWIALSRVICHDFHFLLQVVPCFQKNYFKAYNENDIKSNLNWPHEQHRYC